MQDVKVGPKGSLKRRIMSGGVWTLGNRMIVMLTQMLTLALIARLLGPENTGAYLLVMTQVFVISIIAQLGLAQTQVRLIAEALANKLLGRARQVIIKVIWLGGVSSLLLGMLMFFGANDLLARHVFESEAMLTVGGLTAIWIFLQTIQRLLAESFRGMHDLRMAALFGGVVTGIVTVSGLSWLALTRGSAQLSEVLFISVIAFGFSSLLAGMLVLRKSRHLHGNGSITTGEILGITWPLLIASLTNTILTRADIWILGGFVPEAEVAVYGGAARIITVVTVPLVMASAVLAPMIAELNTRGEKERLERVMRVVATLGGLPAIAVILIFAVFGESILELMYGNEVYKGGWSVLVILALGQMVSVWAGVCIQLLMMTGHQKMVMNTTLLAATLSVVLAVLLVGPLGVNGVAFAFALGIAIQNITMVIYSRRKMGVRSYMFINPMAVLALRREMRQLRNSANKTSRE